MERRTAEDQSPDLEQTREQIAEWRRTRERRTRMPEDLWQRAVELARKHGLWATSQALRVRYENLKARLEPHPAASSHNGTGFVELAAPPRPIAPSTCIDRRDWRRIAKRAQFEQDSLFFVIAGRQSECGRFGGKTLLRKC